MALTKRSTAAILSLAMASIFTMGVNSCSEPSEFCKFYDAKSDREACTTFCQAFADPSAPANGDATAPTNKLTACQLGQAAYVLKLKSSSPEDVLLLCDRQLSTDAGLDEACRAGVAAETVRASQGRYGHGTANDRETGNSH